MDEARLVRRLKQKKRGALEAAIDHYSPYVGAIAYRVMGGAATREDLEEVVSDVFLALWAHTDDLEPDRSPRPWLGTVARNKAKNKLRCSAPAQGATLPLDEAVLSSPLLPEEEAERREQAEQVWRLVDALPEPDRALFLRYYYEGHKLKDIARDLGINLSTAKTRLARGRQTLKTRLMEGGGGYEAPDTPTL